MSEQIPEPLSNEKEGHMIDNAHDSPNTAAPRPKIEQETIVATLVDLPRIKVQLIKYEFGKDRHFLLRRMKWGAAENVRGSEIKLEEGAARILVDELGAALKAPRIPSTDIRDIFSETSGNAA